MSNSTMVCGAPARRSDAWRVYRIRTANSLYELEVQESGGERRLCVLTKLDVAERPLQAFEDSGPRIGARSLYDVSPLEWIGERLSVGTAMTTDVQSVDFVRQSGTRTRQPLASSPPPPASPTPQQERPTWAPFPLGSIEMVEAAASVLGAVCHRHELIAAVRADPRLARRLWLAVAQCEVMIETLGGRVEGLRVLSKTS